MLATRFAFTFFQAQSMLTSSTNALIRDIGNKLKAGFSSDAAAASSGRTDEPIVRAVAEPGKLGSPIVRGFPRDKSLGGSSLFFIVWPFLFQLPTLFETIREVQYHSLC